MKTVIALVLGILLGVSGEFIFPAKAEKPKTEEKSVGEQICYVLVLNRELRRCYW